MHFERVQELMARISVTDDLQLRLFSFEQKKQLDKDTFYNDLVRMLTTT